MLFKSISGKQMKKKLKEIHLKKLGEEVPQ